MRNIHPALPPAKMILALDLGKFKSVACVLEVAGNVHRFQTILTSPSAVHDLLAELMPDRLVIEACSISGWVCDIARAMEIAVQVANTNEEAWNWKKVKRKTDRVDAFKLAKLSLLEQLTEVQTGVFAKWNETRQSAIAKSVISNSGMTLTRVAEC